GSSIGGVLRTVYKAYNLTLPAGSQFVAAFHRFHERTYGHADPHRPVEIVNVRCRAVGVFPRINLPRVAKVRPGTRPAAAVFTKCFVSGKSREVPLFERGSLRHGHEFTRPATITEYSATSFVPANWQAQVDAHAQIHLTRPAETRRHRG